MAEGATQMLQSTEGVVLQGIAAEVLHEDQARPVAVSMQGEVDLQHLLLLDVRQAPVISPRLYPGGSSLTFADILEDLR